MSSSCEKAALVALKAAKYAAMHKADQFTRATRKKVFTFDNNGQLIDTTWSRSYREVPISPSGPRPSGPDLDGLGPSLRWPGLDGQAGQGAGLIEQLERAGINPVAYANEMGIHTPWIDTTLDWLGKQTSRASIKGYLNSRNLNGELPERLGSALRIASKRGVLGVLLEGVAGFTIREIAASEGVTAKTLYRQLDQYRLALKRYAIA